MFCKTIYIEKYADYYKRADKTELSLKLAETLLALNALHPFREGNGRTQREFVRELAEEQGYRLSFEHFTQKEMIELSDLTLSSQILANKLIQGMETILKPMVITKEIEDQTNEKEEKWLY